MIAVAMVATDDGFRFAWPAAPAWESVVATLFPLFSQSARIAAPTAMFLFLKTATTAPADSPPRPAAVECLRWAAVATFAAHGLEAWQHYHVFVDMNIIASRKTLGLSMSQSQSEALLTAIGLADIAVAAVAAATKSRAAAGYMAGWGLLTAASRIVVQGWFLGLWGFATRVPHAIVPLVLWFVWRRETSTEEFEQEAEPAENVTSSRQSASANARP